MNEKVKQMLPRNAVLKAKGLRDEMRLLKSGSFYKRGFEYAQTWNKTPGAAPNANTPPPAIQNNPLWDYFCSIEKGHGIWKWHHYFPIYHQHLQKFIGKPVKIVEIGIFSGGSLPMWKSYFGPQCHIYGVDIMEACKAYQSDDVSVFIGDQEDPVFWDKFIKEVGDVDIVIDDGGHTHGQMIVTLEKMLPHLRPGGVFICEDIQGLHHKFTEFVFGLASELNRIGPKSNEVFSASGFQSYCNSIHLYPFVTVIERTLQSRSNLFSLKHGTEWQPFYKQYDS
jgi:hypothetical protein